MIRHKNNIIPSSSIHNCAFPTIYSNLNFIWLFLLNSAYRVVGEQLHAHFKSNHKRGNCSSCLYSFHYPFGSLDVFDSYISLNKMLLHASKISNLFPRIVPRVKSTNIENG